MMRRGIGLAAFLALTACHHSRPDADAAPCDSVTAQQPADMDLGLLNGTYAVKFVATQGPRAGQSVNGRMVLYPQDSGLMTVERADTNAVVSQPSIGQLDLALEDVGATRMGDPMAESHTTPGVGLYVTRLHDGSVQGIVARVGSGSNVRDQMLFDGGYFTLFVSRVAPEGVWGTWRSAPGTGGMVVPEARGHFCALRATGT